MAISKIKIGNEEHELLTKIENVEGLESSLNNIQESVGSKMDVNNPTGSGSLSINKKPSNENYENTVAVGDNNEVTWHNAFASGDQTSADWRSHSEGYLTTAVNTGHAEGRLSQATGKGSHAEGKSAYSEFTPAVTLIGDTDITIDSNTIMIQPVPVSLDVGSFIDIYPNEIVPTYGKRIATDVKRIDEFRLVLLADDESVFLDRNGWVAEDGDITLTNNELTATWTTLMGYRLPQSGDFIHFAIVGYEDLEDTNKLFRVLQVKNINGNQATLVLSGNFDFIKGLIEELKTGEGLYVYNFVPTYVAAELTLNSPFRHYNYDKPETPNGDGKIPLGSPIRQHIPCVASGDTAHTEGEGTLASGANSHAQGHKTEARGWSSHAEGNQSKSLATYGGHAEGYETTVKGNYGHTEGYNTVVESSSSYGHAEGENTVVEGWRAHAEGWGSKAIGANSHAEGRDTIAENANSHASGKGTITARDNQTVVGQFNVKDTNALFVVGKGESDTSRANAFVVDKDGNAYVSDKKVATEAYVDEKVANGGSNVEIPKDLNNMNSIGFGYSSTSDSPIITYSTDPADGTIMLKMPEFIVGTHLEHGEPRTYIRDTNITLSNNDGVLSIKPNGIFFHDRNFIKPGSGQHSVNEGYNNTVTSFAGHVEGGESVVETSYYGHAEGCKTKVTGMCGHAEGRCTQANGIGAHAEGSNYNKSGAKDDTGYLSKDGTTNIIGSIASSHNSHAEGFQTHAKGFSSHAEGYRTYASGEHSHAEGEETQTIGGRSHAEGRYSVAEGWNSHAEGARTWAKGESAHAEGNRSEAHGTNSHAAGLHTIATGDNQTVIGKYNVKDSTKAFIIGGGSSDTDRKNVFTVDWDGNIEGNFKFDEIIIGEYIEQEGGFIPPESATEIRQGYIEVASDFYGDSTKITGSGIETTGNITAANYPAYTSADEGKILMIKDGKPQWVNITELFPIAEGVSF